MIMSTERPKTTKSVENLKNIKKELKKIVFGRPYKLRENVIHDGKMYLVDQEIDSKVHGKEVYEALKESREYQD